MEQSDDSGLLFAAGVIFLTSIAFEDPHSLSIAVVQKTSSRD